MTATFCDVISEWPQKVLKIGVCVPVEPRPRKQSNCHHWPRSAKKAMFYLTVLEGSRSYRRNQSAEILFLQ